MNKIGILTFHYSNNYGGVLQALSLYNTIKSLGYNVEIINFVPSSYKPYRIISNLGIRKKILSNELRNFNPIKILKKINIMRKHCETISNKFNQFRNTEMNLSQQVEENSLKNILNNYSAIVVGSDQVWNPSQRKSPVYFLNFGDSYNGEKISYATDSTTDEIRAEDFDILKIALNQFDFISVRNDHTHKFVEKIIEKDVQIVADPTLLSDIISISEFKGNNEEYILTYILGKEIDGSHRDVISKIKKKFGDIPVYSIKIPTINFDLAPFSTKVYYNLDPYEWMSMFKNARFVYTDSFHGVLFSLKYHKPFIAYYKEELRATRFIDLGKRYNIAKFIIRNSNEIDEKGSLDEMPSFATIDKIIEKQKSNSIDFLKNALKVIDN